MIAIFGLLAVPFRSYIEAAFRSPTGRSGTSR
jgi:hypothetical protein